MHSPLRKLVAAYLHSKVVPPVMQLKKEALECNLHVEHLPVNNLALFFIARAPAPVLPVLPGTSAT